VVARCHGCWTCKGQFHRRNGRRPSRSAARTDVFYYIETFYNPKRRQGTAGNASPVEFE